MIYDKPDLFPAGDRSFRERRPLFFMKIAHIHPPLFFLPDQTTTGKSFRPGFLPHFRFPIEPGQTVPEGKV